MKKFNDNPPVDWLVNGLIGRQGITILAAEPGVGKTVLALQLSACCMEPKPFLTLPTKKGRVMWVSQDESPLDVYDKIKSMKCLSQVLEDLEYHDCDVSFQLRDSIIGLKDASVDYDLLILDSLQALDVENENAARPAARAVRVLRAIAAQNNLGILLLHHLNQNNNFFTPIEDRIRGSSAILGAVDRALVMMPGPGQQVTLQTTRKFRGRRQFDKIILDWDWTNLHLRVASFHHPGLDKGIKV